VAIPNQLEADSLGISWSTILTAEIADTFRLINTSPPPPSFITVVGTDLIFTPTTATVLDTYTYQLVSDNGVCEPLTTTLEVEVVLDCSKAGFTPELWTTPKFDEASPPIHYTIG